MAASTVTERLRAAGILDPGTTVAEAQRAGLPLKLACAMLEKESAGGHNVFGHDRGTIFAGAGAVTEEKYREYKRKRVASGNKLMQGVGPCQLTWWSIQDAADKAGGCWRPEINMRIGFGHLAGLVKQHGEADGARRYNGSGDAAVAYSKDLLAKARKWETILAGARVTGVAAPRVVRLGDAGALVEKITRRLSYVPSRKTRAPYLDGARRRFGSKAEAALKAFQAEHGLTADGVFGPGDRAQAQPGGPAREGQAQGWRPGSRSHAGTCARPEGAARAAARARGPGAAGGRRDRRCVEDARRVRANGAGGCSSGCGRARAVGRRSRSTRRPPRRSPTWRRSCCGSRRSSGRSSRSSSARRPARRRVRPRAPRSPRAARRSSRGRPRSPRRRSCRPARARRRPRATAMAAAAASRRGPRHRRASCRSCPKRSSRRASHGSTARSTARGPSSSGAMARSRRSWRSCFRRNAGPARGRHRARATRTCRARARSRIPWSTTSATARAARSSRPSSAIAGCSCAARSSRWPASWPRRATRSTRSCAARCAARRARRSAQGWPRRSGSRRCERPST